MDNVDLRKAAIIGCGYVGAASAFALMQSGMLSELVLLDVNRQKAEGEALDISHGLPFARPMDIHTGGYDEMTDAAVVIITAGANQKPGETRIDLARKNVDVFKSIMAEIRSRRFRGILLVVANPVDLLTQIALRYSGLPEGRVMGSGTVLDTARLKYLLGEHLRVDSRSVHAFMIGEHGDSEIAVWSSASVSGVPIHDFCKMRGYANHQEAMQRIAWGVKNSAYEIIEKKQATYYGVAMSVRRICEAIIRDEKSILPVSGMLHGQFGVDGVALSMPAIVGKDGIEGRVPIQLNAAEAQAFRQSAEKLRGIAAEYDRGE